MCHLVLFEMYSHSYCGNLRMGVMRWLHVADRRESSMVHIIYFSSMGIVYFDGVIVILLSSHENRMKYHWCPMEVFQSHGSPM